MLSPPRRRPPSADTDRQIAIKACLRHLKDLRRAHRAAPADLVIPSRSIPHRVDPVPTASWCSSPARMCAELAE